MLLKNLISKYGSLPIQIKGSLWFLMCSFLQKGVSVITTPIFTRLLTPLEYGQYSVFSSWYSMISVVVSLNLFCGVYTQGLVKFENNRKAYSSSLQGLCTTLIVSWTVIYLLLERFWNSVFGLTTVQMLAMLVMIWTSAVFSFWSVEQRVDFKYRLLAGVTLAVTIAKPFISILLITHANDKVTARILALMLVELVAYSAFFFIQLQKGKVFFFKKYWSYALLFNLPLIPHYLSQSILNSMDRIMIDKMIGPTAAGIYSLAYSLSMLMTMLNSALMQTIEPWLYKKIKNKQAEDIKKVAYPVFTMVALVNCY